MTSAPRVILSGFADEATHHRTAIEQFTSFAALGLEYYSLRYVDVGHGIKHVMELNKSEITKLRHLEGEFGMNVASIGSPLGKVKLLDQEDGTSHRFLPFKRYLQTEVKKACELAHTFETKLIRGFSFYPPQGSDPWEHLPQAVDQLGEIVETCHRSDLTFGLEIETGLVGQTGPLIAELHRRINHPALVTVFDGANIVSQGCNRIETYLQYLAMKPSLGWIHVKDLVMGSDGPLAANEGRTFVPPDLGDSGYPSILQDFAKEIPSLERRLKKRGIPGVVLDLEPHLKGADRYGAVSGPDGMAVALRALLRILDFLGIEYHLRDFEDVCADRGY